MATPESHHAPSLRLNLLASYVGQAITALMGIVMLPLYVRYMGAEGFGLVGFYAVVQGCSLVLDLGLTPIVARELARFSAGAAEHRRTAVLVRTLEWVFGGMGLLCGLTVFLLARTIAFDWLNVTDLTRENVTQAVALMGGMLVTQWLIGLYRAGLAGLQHLVVLNVASVFFILVRTVGVWAVLRYMSPTAPAYFLFQVSVCVPELITFRALFYRRFSMDGAGLRPAMGALRGSHALAGGMAFLSALWIVLSQADRVALSSMLDLRMFGYFAVAMTLAGGITQLAAPMIQTLQPRFVVLVAQGLNAGLEELYRTTTQIMTAGIFAIAGAMAFFAHPLLLAWTQNHELAQQAAKVLPPYAIGNGVAALLGLSFSVQFAYGKIRWQVIGASAFGALWLPGVWLAASYAGAVGTGWFWLICNGTYLLLWVSFIHARLIQGLWRRWLVVDVCVVIAVEFATLALLQSMGVPFGGRLTVAISILFAVLAASVAGVALAPNARRHALDLIDRARTTP